MITKEKMLWSTIKFSQLILKGNVWRSDWRICMWTLGLKGLTRRMYFVKSTPIMESFILPDERNFQKIQLEVFDSILIFFNILFFRRKMWAVWTPLLFFWCLVTDMDVSQLISRWDIYGIWLQLLNHLVVIFTCVIREPKNKTIQRNYQLYFTEVVAHRFCI